MIRFVALAVLALLVFLVLRATLYAFLHGLRGDRRPEPGRPTRLDELVKDPVCATYIPRRKAIARGSGPEARYFCSADCADKYVTRA